MPIYALLQFILNIIDINDELISVLSPLWKVDLVSSTIPRLLVVYTSGHYQPRAFTNQLDNLHLLIEIGCWFYMCLYFIINIIILG